MPSRNRLLWTLAAVSFVTSRLLAAGGQDSRTIDPSWPRIFVKDGYVRDAVARSLDGASEWLKTPECQSLFSEFADRRGRPLKERLAELNMGPVDYLRVVVFEDGAAHRQCNAEGVLAFTIIESRVVHVCGRVFARAWRREPLDTRATVIHEVLHSLGLGEKPPAPQYITSRVRQLCW